MLDIQQYLIDLGHKVIVEPGLVSLQHPSAFYMVVTTFISESFGIGLADLVKDKIGEEVRKISDLWDGEDDILSQWLQHEVQKAKLEFTLYGPLGSETADTYTMWWQQMMVTDIGRTKKVMKTAKGYELRDL